MEIGHKIVYLDSVDSTNNYVANLVKLNQIEHGTAIMADLQTAGKGQRGSVWLAESGENILLSLFLKPDNLSVSHQAFLTYFASVSLLTILRKIGISASIKWPNDIYVGNKKIAGILIENSIKAQQINYSILGIGLNVNQLNFEGLNATSIQQEMGQFFQRNDIVFMLLNEMNKNWSLLNVQAPVLKEKFTTNLFQLNELKTYQSEEKRFDGIVRGVNEDGLLLMEVAGELKTFDLKEITFIL
jgi:BirA family biotin operon repressor/biotin-[acetyl-CoA-carboxylase] ligase